MKKIFFFLSIIVLFFGIMPMGCAVIVPPGGGPRDSLPPVLLQSLPKDSTLNFDAKTVTLGFDEYVTLDNIFTNLIVSPIPKSTPTVESHLRTVTIKIKDTLEPNTTYAYNFGRALKDVNEGNVLKNFTYVFSTGDHLDTDSISGKVVLAETGGIDTTLLAVLYKDLSDTAVLKNAPKYYARLDSLGRFVFHFLPKEKFNLFVVPASYMRNYTDSTGYFAFLDSIVSTENDSLSQDLTLYAFQAYPKTTEAKKAPVYSEKQKEKRREQEAKKPLTVALNLSDGKQGLLGPMTITFSKPLKAFDPSKILLTDTNYVPVHEDFKIIPDNNDSTNASFVVERDWQKDEGRLFKMIIPEDAATDSFDVKTEKADTIPFMVKTNHDYATLKLTFPDVDTSQKPVLQIISGDKVIDSIRVDANRQVQIAMFEPGEYSLRVLYDLNGDLKWTPGNYKLKLQPEKVIALKKKFKFIVDTENQWDIYVKKNPNDDADTDDQSSF